MADEVKVRPLSLDLHDVAAWLRRVRNLNDPAALAVATYIVELLDRQARFGLLPQNIVDEMCDESGVKRRKMQYGLKALETNYLLNRRMVGGLPGQGSQRANILEPLMPEEDEEPDGLGTERGVIAPARAGPEKKGPEGKSPPAAPGRRGKAPRQEPQQKNDKIDYHP